MEYEVMDSVKLPEGRHEGVIIGVEYRVAPYKYSDVIIESEGVRVSASYPSCVTGSSKLGALFKRFGVELAIGGKVDDKVLIGRKVYFFTVMRLSKKDGHEYAEVLVETLKPLTAT
jgi:hypothetical protein